MRRNTIFNEISLRNPRGDIFGGITAAVIALPMALAFGVASGAGAEARVVMGMALLGGMFIATLLGVFFYPMLFVFIGKIAKYEQKRDLQSGPEPKEL